MSTRSNRYAQCLARLRHWVVPPVASLHIHYAPACTVSIPITITKRKDVAPNAPLLIMGYGAYGHNAQLHFRNKYIALLDHGWIVARAHVRGGGELGKKWYADGKQLNKVSGMEWHCMLQVAMLHSSTNDGVCVCVCVCAEQQR
jgi:hypothetical protein